MENKKLKVGMYIRTRDGNISKIKYINKFIYTDKQRYGKHYIEKASENIIDLIEVGDYVNGDLVLFAGATTWDNDGNVLDKQVYINHNGYDLWLREEYIKSIVTKEMYSSVEYRVEAD